MGYSDFRFGWFWLEYKIIAMVAWSPKGSSLSHFNNWLRVVDEVSGVGAFGGWGGVMEAGGGTAPTGGPCGLGAIIGPSLGFGGHAAP